MSTHSIATPGVDVASTATPLPTCGMHGCKNAALGMNKFCDEHNRRQVTDVSADDLHGLLVANATDMATEVDAEQGMPVLLPARFSRVSAVERMHVEWLWERRIPVGMVVTMAGDGGVGKSTAAQHIAAGVTRGIPLPHGGRISSPRGVVLLSAEEHGSAVIRPRLDLMGADLDAVAILAIEDGDDEVPFTLPSGLKELEQAMRAIDAGLVILDTGPSFMDHGLKSNSEEDIRRVLKPLARVAERNHASALVLCHLNKGVGTGGDRVMGGAAWKNAARALLMVGVPGRLHQSETSERVIAVEKMNLGRYPDAVTFTLVGFPGEEELADVVWGGLTDVSAAELTQHAESPDERGAKDDAKEWLQEALADGPVLATDLKAQAKREHHAWRTVRRAADDLGVTKDLASKQTTWNLAERGHRV